MAFAVPPFKELLEIPQDHRDADWEALFLREFPKQNIRVLQAEPISGPDGWPYLLAETGETGETADEPASTVLKWLSTRGIGLALNPQKAAPDFVFSYGMVWNFRERGAFMSPAQERASGQFRLKPGEVVATGAPSESYLPQYARSILKQFFLDQGVMVPKILLVSEDRKIYDLCFSLESLGSPPEKERSGIAEAISWFLPAHYSIALISEKAINGFEPL